MLCSVGDIRAVLAARRVMHGRSLSLHGRARSDSGPGRATVVAGRRVGKAVDRNRAKRRLRSVLRGDRPPSGVDLVLVARPPAVAVPYASLVDEYRRLSQRLLGQLERAA